MHLTEQPLPQHPGPLWPLQTTPVIPAITSFTVDDVHNLELHAREALAAVRADAAEQIHSLTVTAVRLAEERDRVQRENSALVAAAFTLVADGIRREEELQAALATVESERDQARRDRNIAIANARISDEMTAAMSRTLDDKHLELRRVCDQFADAHEEISRLQTELDAATTKPAQVERRGRFRRSH